MDIFNRKRVKELEKRLFDAERARDRYREDFDIISKKFEAIRQLEESTPSDCVRGPWCRACEFVRSFHYREYPSHGYSSLVTAYICSKGDSCKHFTLRKDEEE